MFTFHYRQSNVGGFWDGPKSLIVEAKSASRADQIAAERLGSSFNGYCSCCGERWGRASRIGELLKIGDRAWEVHGR